MTTAHEFAARLTGREYGKEITKAEAAEAKAAGLVVVFGYSDDGVCVRGAIDDDADAYNGTTLRVTVSGRLLADWDSLDHSDEAAAQAYFMNKLSGFRIIEALWASEGEYSWTFSTEITHATFEITDGGEPLCRGIVFSLSALADGAQVEADTTTADMFAGGAGGAA